MAAKKAQATQEPVEILAISTSKVEFAIVGRTPLVLNRMSEKARHELLLPKKKSAAEKQSTLKHDPLQEYVASAYRSQDDDAPTRLLHLATAFKSAMKSAAIDMPGAAKAQIGRLTWVEGNYVSIYGVPKLLISVVRNSDMNKTPDIRSRAIVPEWACRISIEFVRPLLREKDVINLLAASGIIRGVGDWRPEKGSGTYGQFELVSANDPRFMKILKEGGRKAQDEALKNPECYDTESAEMLAWFTDEATRRGFKVA